MEGDRETRGKEYFRRKTIQKKIAGKKSIWSQGFFLEDYHIVLSLGKFCDNKKRARYGFGPKKARKQEALQAKEASKKVLGLVLVLVPSLWVKWALPNPNLTTVPPLAHLSVTTFPLLFPLPFFFLWNV